MSRRAESLAARIEEGAAGLAAFAEGLSEEEWRAPVSATDGRSVGVIVHHVATMYPIEIDVARALASGPTPRKAGPGGAAAQRLQSTPPRAPRGTPRLIHLGRGVGHRAPWARRKCRKRNGETCPGNACPRLANR